MKNVTKSEQAQSKSSQRLNSAGPHADATTHQPPRLLSYLIACAPSLAIALLLISYSQFYYFQDVLQSQTDIPGLPLAKILAGIGVLLLTLILLVPLAYSRLGLQRVVPALLYTTILYAFTIIFLECCLGVDIPIPATYTQADTHYTPIQKKLQWLIQRRGGKSSRTIRDVQVASNYNSFGWPDKERTFSNPGTRFLFIGDSFLHVRSSRNLAQRVESNLNLHIENVEVINLAEADTSPVDYRYRLFDLAFDYEPDHIMIFIYAGNDLQRNYKHQPYVPMPFYVTSEAIRILQSTDQHSKDVLQTLIQLQQEHRGFTNKEELFLALAGHDLAISDRAFIYFITFAYSSAQSQQFPLENVAPHTLTRLTKIWEYVFVPQSNPNSSVTISQTRPKWRDFQNEFNSLFSLPKEERLSHIAKMAASYNELSDPQPFLKKLQDVDPLWLEEILAEPDVTYFVWPAITKLVLDQPKKFEEPQPEDVQATVEEYLKLFREFKNESERHGIGITIVLIPEASQADEGFHRFWISLIDFRKWKAFTHASTRILAQQLPSIAPTVNLLDYNEQLGDSYWRIDGHWNETGNAVTADIVTNYILQNIEDIR